MKAVRRLAHGHAKSKAASPWVGLSAFNYFDNVIARDCRRDLATVIAGRVRIADALASRVSDVDRYRVAAAADLLGADGLTIPYSYEEYPFATVTSKRARNIGSYSASCKPNTRSALCGRIADQNENQ